MTWGELDVPMLGIHNDWEGRPFDPPAAYSLVADPERLWFVAHHPRPAALHPDARPGEFRAELWKHDVAELFLADPTSGRYFEFNLAPNGAWWSCEFTAPRQRAEQADIAMPDVATFADLAADGSWLAAMAVPLDLLDARLNFGKGTRANVSMVLGHPEPRHLSANDLGGGAPDFHRPYQFAAVRFHPVGDLLSAPVPPVP